MKSLNKINSSSVIALSDTLKSPTIDNVIARNTLLDLGRELGRCIKTSYYKKKKSINVLDQPLSLIITTKADASTFGQGLQEALSPSKVGYMNFEGMRGPSTLNAPIREIMLPHLNNQIVDYLIIAKSVLATGCTAISLTKTAINEYNPKCIIIVTVFYSIVGVNELRAAFPNVNIVFVGEPYCLRNNGMLDVDLTLPDEQY